MKILSKETQKKTALLFLSFWMIIMGFTSCVSYKTVTYFQADSTQRELGSNMIDFTPTIQKGDLLSVVIGSIQGEANETFAIRNSAMVANVNYSTTGAAGARLQPVGYLVTKEGTIEVPLIGKIEVMGLTTEEAAEKITQSLTKYLKDPSVVVRNVNFKISVLGEVKTPATFVIPDETITIPQALSLAGDLTIFGRRENVLVVRESNGKRIYGSVDLTSRTMFESPFYHLHKNDVIYVEPTKSKITSSDRTLQILPLVLSSISVLAVIATRIF